MRDRETRFCEEYMIDLNAKAAAIRAGYRPSTAGNAFKWIRLENPEKPALRARIDELLAERSRRTGINADRVLLELGRVGFARLSDVMDTQEGRLRPDAPEDDVAAIASVRVSSGDGGTTTEVRMFDKLRALELMGRHLGMFNDNVNVNIGQMPRILVREDGSAEIGNAEEE